MPRPRYPLESTGGEGGSARALARVSLDIDALNESLSAVPYTPASSSDWSGSPPTNLQQALDRIAAAIGPIP